MFFASLLQLVAALLSGGSGQTGLVVETGPRFVMSSSSAELGIGAEKSAALIADDRFFLHQDRADEVQPIASITKLMTALVFLDTKPDWERVYRIRAEDNVPGGRLHLFLGDELTLRDLFYTSLIASDNGATQALVSASGLGTEEFVRRMNEKAAVLDLRQTSFVDPAGLGEGNVSSAREVALLAQTAFRREEIRAAAGLAEYSFTTVGGRAKYIEATDHYLVNLGETVRVLGGKTGYIEESGYCYVGWFRHPDGREVIAAVLNSAGRNERFVDSQRLAAWIFDNYVW